MNVNYAGNWNSGTSYNQGDFVVYQNVMYIALGNVLAGQLPPDVNLSWELVVYGAQFGPVTPTPTVTPGLTATPTPTTSEIPVTPTPTITITPTSSEIPVTPTPTPTITITPTSSEIPVTPTPTETIGITPTPTPTELVQQLLNPIITEELDVYISVGNNEYLQFNDPSTPPTPTPTSSEIPVTPTVTITPTSSEIPVTPSATVTPTTSSLGVTPTPTPSSGATPSGFTVTIQEVGPDVVWSGSGSLNLNDLTLQNTQTITAGYSANQAIWTAGPITPTNCELWSGPSFTTYPTSFGSGGIAPTSSTGSIFGIIPGGSGRTIIVPSGYVSGSLLNGTTTYDNTTILDMGLTPGTYVWSWGTGPNADSITMIIG